MEKKQNKKKQETNELIIYFTILHIYFTIETSQYLTDEN